MKIKYGKLQNADVCRESNANNLTTEIVCYNSRIST